MANVGGHASQRDTCHLCAAYAAAYALLRRWERLRVGERSSGMASPPTCGSYALLRAETLFRPYNGANVGGHASQRDTSHMCTSYALLRRWEASPPTLPLMRCCGRKRCSAPTIALM